MLVSQIINEVAIDLTDGNFELWTKDEMLSYLNDAQLQICMYRPDSLSGSQAFILSKGTTKQSLPVGFNRMLSGVIRNMGADGLTVGKVIRPVDQESLDLIDSNWHNQTASLIINNIVYNEKNPKEFFVTPPAHAVTDVYIEAVLSKSPVNILIADFDTAQTEIDDIYKTVIKEFMYYRAYSKETDSAESRSLAKSHEQTFYNLLGVKVKVDMTNSVAQEVNQSNG